ncbi:23S rRNA (guanosine(2251)-2'-O)-methyltransferase RlmB [Mycoplasma sp. 1654_15]|uniref:23S rRNA (guanosine(2251)-2'-O)-methyltransferase RlmB n=1 Tax=Mycoplasma sp. 1654_15 TaxID=2725994 RepID=UPI001449D1F0|nr:23S rRNA (guanosine(2251)-2'-O)-methyltransferase RlmB [Mycoplasma sp. 1654_15]QJB71360.1 23S rRNA (guanosine(2251)-2'-O)-methyltransferase RlmB [Mycoplasma sp. 1654_15]
MVKYICGKNSLLDAIKNNIPIKKIYLAKPLVDIDLKKFEVKIVEKTFLDKLAKGINHQGFVAEVENVKYFPIESIFKDNPERILILDHIQDNHNLGAIIRSANAAGIKHIILPKDNCAKINETVIRISSGGFVGIKFVQVNSLLATIDKLKKRNFWIYSSALTKQAKSIETINFNLPTAIVLGSEAKGVSKSLLNQSDETFYIPMQGTVQSLNVSVAAGIILFKK